jgi:hypothetical protein
MTTLTNVKLKKTASSGLKQRKVKINQDVPTPTTTALGQKDKSSNIIS